MIELSTRTNNGSTSGSDTNNDSNYSSKSSVSTETWDNTIESNKPYTTETSQPNMENSKENILSGNRYKESIIDDESDFSDMVQNSGIKITRYTNQEDNIIKGQRENKLNKKPRNKTDIYNKGNHVPGNSSYSEITKDGKKVLILSDSICSRI